jgi:hypothetical protein
VLIDYTVDDTPQTAFKQSSWERYWIQ